MSTANIPVSEATQLAQLGSEAAWGTEVPATILLKSVKITDALKIGSEKFKASGAKVTSLHIPGLSNGELSFSGWATYEELSYFVTEIKAAAETTVPAYTVEKGTTSNGMQYPGCVVDSWSLKGDTKGVALNGKMFSKTWSDNPVTGSLEADVPTPVQNAHVTIKLDGTPITTWFEFDLSVSKLWEACQYGGSNSLGGANEGDIEATFTLKLEANAGNKALITSGLVAVTVIFDGGGTDYFKFDFQAEMDEPEAFSANGKVYAFGLKMALMDSPDVAGKLLAITTARPA